MLNKITAYCILFVSFIPYTFSQQPYPQNIFSSPLDIPLYLSGSFGELRNNHFHSGIDIKTQGVEGKDVYAVADGTLYRGSYAVGCTLSYAKLAHKDSNISTLYLHTYTQ